MAALTRNTHLQLRRNAQNELMRLVFILTTYLKVFNQLRAIIDDQRHDPIQLNDVEKRCFDIDKEDLRFFHRSFALRGAPEQATAAISAENPNLLTPMNAVVQAYIERNNYQRPIDTYHRFAMFLDDTAVKVQKYNDHLPDDKMELHEYPGFLIEDFNAINNQENEAQHQPQI